MSIGVLEAAEAIEKCFKIYTDQGYERKLLHSGKYTVQFSKLTHVDGMQFTRLDIYDRSTYKAKKGINVQK